MATPRTDFSPIRACLFDMDGLLINTEDIYTQCHNILLSTYSAGPMDWIIKPQLQGRPAAEAIRRLLAYFNLTHIDAVEYTSKLHAIQDIEFRKAEPLPGALKLLQDLNNTGKVHIALATSSSKWHFGIKTSRLGDMFTLFPENRQILGDDTRIAKGRGKPSPDIYLLALKAINETLEEGEEKIKPEECLVFEDAVPGVVAGRRAGMRVVWVPHQDLAKVMQGKEDLVLAGRGEEGEEEMSGEVVGEIGDGWAEQRISLADFPYEKYGIAVK
ncbi:HAD-like protein [Mollisia scopiformis]|uniref:HAD-like protein n=1 Tax=Mollisia scopiformis TaxID=149040 RepID=A0A194XDG4_MOLSC|nr:HAD-like protein [Mollisia scopiformis]KUJ18191.1 HAD-like protein [Mollisia scopiformis]